MHARPEGTARLSRALDERKRQGSSVAVVGDTPEAAMDRTSARFLGARNDRVRLFALRGGGLGRVHRRLDMAGPGRNPATVLAAGVHGDRSAASATPVEPGPGLDVRTVDPSLEALEHAVVTGVADARRRHGPLGPAALRLCVDVFPGGVRLGDVATLAGFLETVRDAVVDADGMAHTLLPVARTSDLVGELRSQFDVVVELRTTNGTVEQRWTVPDEDIETQWVELDQS